MQRACWMTLKCSAEPKRRDVAQIAVFEEEPVPLWLKDKMRPKGQESGFRYRSAQRMLKSRYLSAAFLYALRGASHGITSIGFVLPLKPTKPAANCRKGLAAPVTPIFRRKE